jgi:hypothetical protein
MNRNLRTVALGAVMAVVLALGTAPILAEDSGVFKNPEDISRAQRILVGEGYLAPGSYTPGQLDQATRQALSEYQGRHSLNDSGTLDDETYQTLLGHEVSFPWGDEATPQAAAAPAEPLASVAAPTPVAEPQVAEEAPNPEPAPSPAAVEAAPEPTKEPVREMPATASHLPFLVLAGLLLLGCGILVLRRRTA